MAAIDVRREGIALDFLLWRRFGPDGVSLVEQTLALNPGLADLGPIIPIGTQIVLPDTMPETSAAETPVVSLFG